MNPPLDRVTATVCRVGGLPAVGADDDFYAAGFSSVRSLELLLELETEFGVSVPDDAFIAARTPAAVAALVSRLQTEGSL